MHFNVLIHFQVRYKDIYLAPAHCGLLWTLFLALQMTTLKKKKKKASKDTVVFSMGDSSLK